jgi:HTH-type transcriptional regulator/antitoxin HigA|nr:MAG: transcriptional regulator [Bacteroidota bacterium]
MVELKYKVIKSKAQYREYSRILEDLVAAEFKSKEMKDEIDLLTLLLEKWDEEHNSFDEVDPIELLRSLMAERNLKAKDLVEILGVSKGLVSDVLNYKKGLSKEMIRKLSQYFKVSQEAFNRPYELVAAVKA